MKDERILRGLDDSAMICIEIGLDLDAGWLAALRTPHSPHQREWIAPAFSVGDAHAVRGFCDLGYRRFVDDDGPRDLANAFEICCMPPTGCIIVACQSHASS